MPVYAQDGKDLGVVVGLVFCPELWHVVALEVRLRSEVVPLLHVRKPWFRAAVGTIQVDQVAGFDDSVVLSVPADGVLIGGLKQRRADGTAEVMLLGAPHDDEENEDEEGYFTDRDGLEREPSSRD